MERELFNSEQVVRVESLNDYERKVYEGQIKALEERLNYYIKKFENGKANS